MKFLLTDELILPDNCSGSYTLISLKKEDFKNHISFATRNDVLYVYDFNEDLKKYINDEFDIFITNDKITTDFNICPGDNILVVKNINDEKHHYIIIYNYDL